MADQTESSTTIAAPPDQIMAVIADMDSYPSWNEEVKEVEVLSVYDDAQAHPAQVRFVLDAGAIKDEYTLAYDWNGNSSASWSLVRAGMLTTMEGSYVLSDRGDGTTDVTYRLLVDVRIPMIGLIKRKAEKVIIDRALKGLKKRVEA